MQIGDKITNGTVNAEVVALGKSDVAKSSDGKIFEITGSWNLLPKCPFALGDIIKCGTVEAEIRADNKPWAITQDGEKVSGWLCHDTRSEWKKVGHKYWGDLRISDKVEYSAYGIDHVFTILDLRDRVGDVDKYTDNSGAVWGGPRSMMDVQYRNKIFKFKEEKFKPGDRVKHETGGVWTVIAKKDYIGNIPPYANKNEQIIYVKNNMGKSWAYEKYLKSVPKESLAQEMFRAYDSNARSWDNLNEPYREKWEKLAAYIEKNYTKK